MPKRLKVGFSWVTLSFERIAKKLGVTRQGQGMKSLVYGGCRGVLKQHPACKRTSIWRKKKVKEIRAVQKQNNENIVNVA
jgi:hypothetical protein